MQVMQLINDSVSNQQRAAVMILHDMNTVARFCDHVLMMFDDGNVLQGTASELLTAKRLESLYGYPIRHIATETQTIFIPA
jgi:iron complex transport system ATP-binding protein